MDAAGTNRSEAVNMPAFNHQLYEDALLTVSTAVEILILVVMLKEGSKVVTGVNEIRESTTTDFGHTQDLPVGSSVHIIQPQPGLSRDQWPYSSEIWKIREVNSEKNRATATPVLPPLEGPIPTVSGPVRGPLSPFRKANIPS